MGPTIRRRHVVSGQVTSPPADRRAASRRWSVRPWPTAPRPDDETAARLGGVKKLLLLVILIALGAVAAKKLREA